MISRKIWVAVKFWIFYISTPCKGFWSKSNPSTTLIHFLFFRCASMNLITKWSTISYCWTSSCIYFYSIALPAVWKSICLSVKHGNPFILPMPFLGSLSFDGLLVVSLLALLNIRVGSKKLCGNSSILLALIFSVKSILANLESLKWPFWPLLSPWFFTYETFLLVSWAEILSYVTFVPLKLPTWPFLKLSICFKIDITENLSSIEIHEFSHCVKFTLVSPNRFHVKIGMRFKMSFWFYEKVLDNGPIQNF